jgi:hypothetical protein
MTTQPKPKPSRPGYPTLPTAEERAHLEECRRRFDEWAIKR